MFGWVRTLHASDGAKNVQFFICLPVSFFLSVTLSNAAATLLGASASFL